MAADDGARQENTKIDSEQKVLMDTVSFEAGMDGELKELAPEILSEIHP